MATLSLRRNLGPLTNDQIDDNFVDLNTDIQTRLLSADAVSANTLGKAVRRDEETGGFSAGAVTLTGINNTGNTTLGTNLTSTITLNGTVGAGVVISGSTSSNALRITQTGSGNALLIEDEANPDATPVVVDTGGKLIVAHTSTVALSTVGPKIQVHNTLQNSAGSIGSYQWGDVSNHATYNLIKSRSSTIGSHATVASGDGLGSIVFWGDDGTDYIVCSSITSDVDGIPATNSIPSRIKFNTTSVGSTSSTERMRIDNTGAVGIGTISLGAFYGLRVNRTLSGSSTVTNIFSSATATATSTSAVYSFRSNIATATNSGTPYTLPNLMHFFAAQDSTFNVDSTVTKQYGFFVDNGMTGAANNYGFYSQLSAGTGRWNFYTSGDAQNYFAGNTGIGGLPSGTYKLEVTGTAYVSSNMTVNGNLTVNGTTTTVNSTIIAIDDPVFTLGGDTAPATDDSKDRGIEFRWHNGTDAKVGFFGFDRSTGKWSFIPDATNTSEVFSGTKGTLDANIEWADILNKPSTATTNSFGSVTTDNTDTEYTWTANGTATSGSAASNLKVVAGDGIQVHVDTTNNAVRITNDDTVDPTVFNENLTLSTNWQDTTINGADLSTGSYMVQITVNDSSVGGGQVNEIYTGMMSWYASDTNSTESDEVQLHRAGNGPGSGAIYLRIQRTATADANDLKLQIIGNTNNSGSATYTFKFRKLI